MTTSVRDTIKFLSFKAELSGGRCFPLSNHKFYTQKKTKTGRKQKEKKNRFQLRLSVTLLHFNYVCVISYTVILVMLI